MKYKQFIPKMIYALQTTDSIKSLILFNEKVNTDRRCVITYKLLNLIFK